jgi:ACS family glucarate transporter-like MFS transporter
LFVVGIGSAFFVMLTGLAGQFWSGTTLLLALLAVRGLMGVVNAPTHPGAARLVGDWIPSGQRSMVNGMVNMAACVGISVTYLAFGILMDHYDWPGACFIAAGVTALIALAWALIAVDAPRKLPAAETPLLERPIRRPGSLLSRSLILLTLSYGALGYFQYLIFYWAQYYFENERALGKDQSRLYASILTLTMGLGMLAGGWLSDRLRSGIRHPRNVAIVPFAGFCGAATMLYVGFIQPDPLATLIFFCLATASIGSCEGAFWTLAVEIGGSRGGLAAGILNTGGNAGGMIAPVLTPMISTAFGWQAGLGVASLVCLVGAACWIGIDPRERLEE